MCCDIEMSCDMSCEEGTGSRPDGAGGVAMALRALESPDWPQLTLAVLGRNGTRREAVQRLAAMLDQCAGRDGRGKPDGDADTGKRGLTERERQIIDMWPRFKDGEPVMLGDEATNNKNQRFTVKRIEFRHGKWMLNDSATEGHYLNGKSGKRVKRPAPKVLDADGMEIKVGDTVYELETGEKYKVERVFSGATDHDFPDHTIRCNKVADLITHVFKPDQLTHTRPDSWERLESDAALSPADYIDKRGRRTDLYAYQEMPMDLVRRAKALAGVEVDE